MPKFNEILHNFLSGEVSPRLYGRTDSQVYRQSCRTLQNNIVVPQGGVRRRVGTQLIQPYFVSLQNPSPNQVLDLIEIPDTVRLIPFIYNKTEQYLVILEARDSSVADSRIRIYNIQDRTSKDYLFSVIDDFTLDQLFEIQFAQNNDFLVLTHEDFFPQALIRTDVDEFSLESWSSFFSSDNEFRIPFAPLNADEISIEASAVTVGSGRTLTASAALFQDGHVDSIWVFFDGTDTGYALITAVASSTSATATITTALPSGFGSGGGLSTWRQPAWSDVFGYPRAVTFWQNRIVFGGTLFGPDTLWGSSLGDIYEMTNDNAIDLGAALTDSDPVTYTLSSSEASQINWLRGSRNLLVGTRQREYSIPLFSNTEVQILPQTGFGSEYLSPAIFGDSPVFVQRGFRKLRMMDFDFRVEGYTSTELSILSEHLAKASQSLYSDAESPKIKQLAVQLLDNSLLWIVDNNGFLFSVTRSLDTEVSAFHRHVPGGELNGGPPKVLSIASVPSEDGTTDDLFMIVERDSGRSIEKLGQDFFEDDLTPSTTERRRLPIFADQAVLFKRDVDSLPDFYLPLHSDTNGVAAYCSGEETAVTVSGTFTHTQDRFAEWPTSGTGGYLEFEGFDNANIEEIGTIRFEVGSFFSSTEYFFSIREASSPNNNLIQLYYDFFSKGINLIVNDDTGSAIINDVTIGILPSGIQIFTLELNLDVSTGATRLFVNGKQLGSTITSTGSRTFTDVDAKLFVGGGPTPDDSDNLVMANFLIWKGETLHTEDHDVFEFLAPAIAGTQTVYNLQPFAGEEVQVLGDGLYLGEKTVTAAGTITLDDEYEILVVGRTYRSIVETNALEAGSAIGSSQSAIKRVDRLAMRFQDTTSAKYGADLDNLTEIVFRDAANIGNPIALFTGDKIVDFEGDYDPNARLFVVCDDPMPCNLTCLIARGVTYD